MRVLVTGADGYIGRGVVRELLAQGNEVIAMGLKPCGVVSDCLFEVVGDIFRSDLGFLEDNVPDVLLHLAWKNGFNHQDPVHIAFLSRHYDFLCKAIEMGVGRLAVMGSMHEVGYHEGAVREGTRCEPTTPYGVAKNALRQLMQGQCEASGVIFQWLRGFYLVSNDGRGDSIFSKIVAASKTGERMFPFSSGKNKYDFLSYDEFCRRVVATISQDEINGIINICSGEPVSLGVQVERFIEINSLDIKLDYGAFPDRSYDSPAIWGDASKIKAILDNAEE